MKIMRVGIDLAKNVFQVHGVDWDERPVWRRKLRRADWMSQLLENIEPGCEIGMAACGGAHHWARQLQARGFTVKVIAPQFVKPYVKSNKNDAQICADDPVARRLRQIRGVGPLTATALVAAVVDAQQFANGRQMAASLGLTPGQNSSGGKERLLGITKRGDAYLRTLLIHGARTVVSHAKNKDDPLSLWANRLAQRGHHNVATVALANKTARIAWAMITKNSHYQTDRMAPVGDGQVAA